MGTSAGIEFKASGRTVAKMRAAIHALNEVVNESGLGVSCVPTITKDGGIYCISGQTHWSYDGENGRALNAEIKKWIADNGFNVEIVGEYDA